jgi:hypothetical protein
VGVVDTKTPGHDIRVLIGVERMKNVTITLDDSIASRARIEAATRGQSLSKFVRGLIEREIGRDARSDLDVIREFTRGLGYPGISRNWRGREELYAEREDELLRRYELARFTRSHQPF